jgi:hypothetical protein
MGKGNKKKKKVTPPVNKVNNQLTVFASSDSDGDYGIPQLVPHNADPNEILKNSNNYDSDSDDDLPMLVMDSDSDGDNDNANVINKNSGIKKGFLLGKDKKTDTKTSDEAPPILLRDSSDDSDSNKKKKKSKKSSKKDISKQNAEAEMSMLEKLKFKNDKSKSKHKPQSDSDSDPPPFLIVDSSDSDSPPNTTKKSTPNPSSKPSIQKGFLFNNKDISKVKKEVSSDEDSDAPPGLLQDSEDSGSDTKTSKKKKKKKKKKKSGKESQDPLLKKGFLLNKQSQEVEKVLEMNSDGVYDSENENASSGPDDNSDDEKGIPPGLVSDSDDSKLYYSLAYSLFYIFH